MKLKEVAVTAATGLMDMALMVCGDKKSEESNVTAGSESGVLSGNMAADVAKVKTVSAGKLTTVTNAELPPYRYHEGNNIKGTDVEICQVATEKLGLKLETKDVVFDVITPEATSGRADLATTGMTVTEDRKQNTGFSDTYASAEQLILVKDDSTLADKDDLRGRKTGVQQGTTSDFISTEDLGDNVVVCFSKSIEAVQVLTQGKIDVVIVGSQTAEQFVKGVLGIKALDVNYLDESYVIGVKKGSTELLDAVNGALSELKPEGKLDETVTQYTKAE